MFSIFSNNPATWSGCLTSRSARCYRPAAVTHTKIHPQWCVCVYRTVCYSSQLLHTHMDTSDFCVFSVFLHSPHAYTLAHPRAFIYRCQSCFFHSNTTPTGSAGGSTSFLPCVCVCVWVKLHMWAHVNCCLLKEKKCLCTLCAVMLNMSSRVPAYWRLSLSKNCWTLNKV